MSENNIDELLKAGSGIITSKHVTDLGYHRSVLSELVNNGKIYRYSRGLYVINDLWEDDFYLLQQKYKRGIYSHETALYLLGYTDRTPIKYTMSFPKGYNSKSIKSENIIIKHVIPNNYSLGLIEIKSPSGNEIYIYNLERTICDLFYGNNTDIQIINEAMKRYVSSKNKDVHKLLIYAEKLRVKPKVLKYLEVLL